MPKEKTKIDRPELFFQGNPITYSAERDRLSVSLTLSNPTKSGWKHGVDYTYQAQVVVKWTDGGMTRSETGWIHHPYWMRDSGNLGGIFNEMVDYSGEISALAGSRTEPQFGPSRSCLIRLVHKIQDEVESEFLQPGQGWLNMRKDLLDKYFPHKPSDDD